MNKCNYCSYDRDDYILAVDKHGHLVLEPYEAVLKVKFYGNKMQTKINYCPMCGRKLEEVNADDT